MPDQPWQWALGALCAVLVGMAKTGVPGLGVLVVPLMVFVIGSGKQASGALLPLLCVADCFAVCWYRRNARWDQIARLSPWVAIGVAAGAVTLRLVDDHTLTRLIGAVVLTMAALQCMRRLTGDMTTAPSLLRAAIFGAIAGFTTTVSNAAGPVMGLYLLSMGLPKDEFMGTGAWFFFIINLIKLPIFAANHSITADSLIYDAWMLPAIALGAGLGRVVYARLPQRAFEIIVLTLSAVAALRLLWAG